MIQMIQPLALIAFLVLSGFAQTISQQKQEQKPGMSGVSTGAARTYTSRRTVGVVEANAPVIFEDVTARTALAKFKHRSGSPDKNYIVETASGGVAIFDYDGDGRPDIYLLNGSTVAGIQGKEKPPRAALYRNLGNWQFQDVTERAGVANERWGMGVAVGDYDNDGRSDIYVGNFGVSRLYHNNGDGTFTDVAPKLGCARKGWSTGASFGDYDGDGRLDIFVPGYLDFDIKSPPPNPSEAGKPGSIGRIFCEFRGVPVMCGPRGLKGENDTLYNQKPDGTLAIAIPGRGLAVGDLDGDGLLDAVINNIDSAPSVLRNVTKPGGHWIELRLVGDPSKKSPRDAIGAIAYVSTGKLRQRADVVSGASYASQNDLKLHFGLGSATRIDKLEVKWPDGALETVGVSGCDRVLTIGEGKGVVNNQR